MQQSGAGLGLERLAALVGRWRMEAGPAAGPTWPGEAEVTFGWLAPGTFLIERWTVPSAFDGIAIIGPGEERGTFRRYYFDAPWGTPHLRDEVG
jgi:hypothetical protein